MKSIVDAQDRRESLTDARESILLSKEDSEDGILGGMFVSIGSTGHVGGGLQVVSNCREFILGRRECKTIAPCFIECLVISVSGCWSLCRRCCCLIGTAGGGGLRGDR